MAHRKRKPLVVATLTLVGAGEGPNDPRGAVPVGRMIEERQVGTHQVAIIEELMDEGVGYLILVDGVLATESEPLEQMPSEEEIRDILRAHGFR